MSMKILLKMHDIIGIDRNTICGYNRFETGTKWGYATKVLSTTQFPLCICLNISSSSLLFILSLLLISLCSSAFCFCSFVLSSSPSFWWFGKMFRSFVRLLETETIHLNFIRFHERELLSVHIYTGSFQASYNHDIGAFALNTRSCVCVRHFQRIKKIVFRTRMANA